MNEIELFYLTVVELAKLLRAKKISSVELTNIYLKRLETRGKALNAVAEMTGQLALKQAKQADEEIARGRFRSLLHGIPYGAKDLLAVKNIPTRWGSPAHADQVFDYDAAVIRKLQEAGAVLVAKLAMIELAGGGGYETAGASITGACLNPWNETRWAGGSSSGSGAATAAGAVGFSIGSETWGSILVPSAFCGVSGLRPTYGRVSRYGAMALSWTMDKIGPMARSAEDCGHILQAIAGSDPNDLGAANIKYRFSSKLPRNLRIGLLKTDFEGNKAADAQKAFDEILNLLKKQKLMMKEVSFPDYPYDVCAALIIMAESAASFADLIRSERLNKLKDNSQQGGLIAGLAVPAADYLRVLQIRREAMQALNRIFDEVDVLIAPTLLKGAISAQRSLNEEWAGMGGNGGAPNLAGIPSLSIPMGFTSDKLPLGLEIIAPAYEENLCLALGALLQKETDWHRQYPEGIYL